MSRPNTSQASSEHGAGAALRVALLSDLLQRDLRWTAAGTLRGRRRGCGAGRAGPVRKGGGSCWLLEPSLLKFSLLVDVGVLKPSL